MTYEEVISRLEEMKPRFDEGFTLSDRSFLDDLHYQLFHKIVTLTGCSDCYRDAYLIMINKLKKDGKMPEANYILKSGEVLHFFGESQYYVNHVPDEVAERCLKQNVANISKFKKFPEDWQKRVGGSEVKESKKRTRK